MTQAELEAIFEAARYRDPKAPPSLEERVEQWIKVSPAVVLPVLGSLALTRKQGLLGLAALMSSDLWGDRVVGDPAARRYKWPILGGTLLLTLTQTWLLKKPLTPLSAPFAGLIGLVTGLSAGVALSTQPRPQKPA
jgi:hypothetical protein